MQKEKDTFLVFRSPAYAYARCVLPALPVLCALEGWWAEAYFLYAVAGVALVLAVFFLTLLSATVQIHEDGLRLRKGFGRTAEMRWEDVLCCGVFRKQLPGIIGASCCIYFSKKSFSYRQVKSQSTLPPLSKDLIFLYVQPGIYEAMQQCGQGKRAEELLRDAPAIQKRQLMS